MTGARQSYDVTGRITALRVDDCAGSIEAVPTTGDSVKVVEKYQHSDGKPRTEHPVHDGQLLLKSSGCGSGADKCAVTYHVEVSATTPAHLTLGGGDIAARGLSGTTYAKSGGGSVDIADSSAKSLTHIHRPACRSGRQSRGESGRPRQPPETAAGGRRRRGDGPPTVIGGVA
ncbi:hypothetical protein ABZ864_38640 [Streptomyces sp. NPDC047082]|uniref:hypothetical protein n=1 Tax=Streptomyces sp. NPDC047082 TaxID=3155259 RepID=UPI0033C0F648